MVVGSGVTVLSARIFVHPRCLSGPASGALSACLQEHGHDLNKLTIGPANHKGHCELVRLLETRPDGSLQLERFDGFQFNHAPNTLPPRAA